MQLTVEHKNIENCKLKVKIGVPYAELESEYKTVKSEISKDIQLPGFRAGKVPDAIIEKRFNKHIQAKVIQNIFPKAYEQAIKDNSLEPFGQPVAEEVSEFEKDKPLTFDITVDRMPNIKLKLGKSLTLEENTYKFKPEDIDEEVKRQTRAKAKLEDKDGGTVETGDYVKFNAVFTDDKYKELSLRDYPLEIKSAESTPLDLYQELLGLKKEGSKTVKKSFKKDYKDEKLAGNTTEIELSIVELKSLDYPELTDELAKEMQYKDVKDMKEKVKLSIERFMDSHKENGQRSSLLEQLRESSEFELPQSMIDYTANQYISQMKAQFNNNEGMLNSYLASRNQKMSDLFAEYQKHAETGLKDDLIIQEVIKENKIEISEEDITKEIEKQAQEMGRSADDVKKEMLRNGTYNNIKNKLSQSAAISALTEKAKTKKGKELKISELLKQG